MYDFIIESEQFKDTMSSLGCIYSSKKNLVFARNKLATDKQKSGESILKYIQKIRITRKKVGILKLLLFTSIETNISDMLLSMNLSTPHTNLLLWGFYFLYIVLF